MSNEDDTSPFMGDEYNDIEGDSQPQKFTLILLLSALIVVLSSFQFGYTLGVTNSPEEAITGVTKNETITAMTENYLYDYFNVTDKPNDGSQCSTGEFFQPCIQQNEVQWSIFVSSFIVSALIGSLLGGPISDLIERRSTIFISNIFFILGNFLTGFFSNYYIFLLGRFIAGFGVGLISVVVPVYLAEISPPKYRGAISTLHQLFLTIAILTSQSLGIPFSSPYMWRFLFTVPILVSIIQMILIPFVPMSPRWLYQKGFTNAAENALKRLRNSDNVYPEIDQLEKSLSTKTEGNFFKRIFRVSLIKPLLVGVILHVAQQFSGVNAIFFYSTKIFKDAGIENANIVTAVIGLVNVLVTLVSVYLVERAGRRVLLLASEIICFLSFTVLSTSMIFIAHVDFAVEFFKILSVASVLFFIVGFAIGLGSIPWVMLSELYPNDVRGFASSIITCLNWALTFLIALTFPTFTNMLKEFTFLPFTFIIFISIILTFFFVPETKGVSIEELTEKL